MAYSFDTSAVVNPWRRYYPFDVFPSLWRRLEQAIDAGLIRASVEVKEELEQKDDELLAYLRQRPEVFVQIDDEQQGWVAEMVNRFPNWIDVDSRRNQADPFVVALAKAHNLTVVTYERPGTAESPKIPHVCQAFAVRCLHFMEFMRETNIRF